MWKCTPMLKIIKEQTKRFLNQANTIKKYVITHAGMEIISTLTPNESKLFLKLLNLSNQNADISGIVLECTYSQLGFNDFSNFNKCRKSLQETRLIFFEKNEYYINPVYVCYYSTSQKNFLKRLFNVSKTKKIKLNKVSLKIIWYFWTYFRQHTFTRRP